jgi:hypothetical protein
MITQSVKFLFCRIIVQQDLRFGEPSLGKFALVRENVFRLQTSTIDNEIGNAGAGELCAGAN